MTDQELKDLVASLAISQKITDQQLRKTDELLKELRASQAETDKMMRQTQKEIGGLGRKFGGFTEGMAYPSMEKILRNRFHMDVIAPNVKVYKDSDTIELDVMAYSNSSNNEVFIVEVKSHLKEDGFQQFQKNLERFFDFFPSHKGKKLYGILAVVDAPLDLRRKVLKEGIYLARIHDDLFEIQVPEEFEPRAYT